MLIADAHVHFHACFRRDQFFDAAWDNLTRFAPNAWEEGRLLPYLLLTETPGVNYFRQWREEAGGPAAVSWRTEETAETCSLLAVRQDGATLVLVSGRQVPTLERLEVLGMGTIRDLPAGLPLRDSLERARESARIVCIPWGFGKWWLGRGATVRQAVEGARPGDFFLGDNAGRLRAGRMPRLFQVARDRGIRILPGSDPFPFRRHEHRVGTICFTVPGPVDFERPMDRLAMALAGGADVIPKGKHSGLLTFVRDQVDLRRGRGTARRRET